MHPRQISKNCYSPFPIEDYRITSLKVCEITSIIDLPQDRRDAVWNLFWLSLPMVDSLPIHGKTATWFKHYNPVLGASKAICADAIADEALFQKLQMHPLRFLDFFERQDPWIYDCYEALGGDAWVATVVERAKASALRLAALEMQAAPIHNVFSIRKR